MSELSFDRVAIFGAGGPTGFHLATELLKGGSRVRVIGRRLDRLEAAFAGIDVETMATDALDPTAAARAADVPWSSAPPAAPAQDLIRSTDGPGWIAVG